MDETPLRRRIGLKESATAATDTSTAAPAWEDDQADPEERPSGSGVRSVLRELVETAIFILLVFLIVRGVVQNFKIEGQSMEPSLHTGQYILVNKIIYFHFDLNAPLRLLPGNTSLPARVVYPFHMPYRGEVVVFEYPRDTSKDYIKRVIGLPGETVTIHDGQVFIDGERLNEPYLEGRTTNCRPDDPCGDSKPFVVPAGSVFVLGDNRPNSSDSREWAELPLDRIIGKAWICYWPREYWGGIASQTYLDLP